ncbi:phospholipase A2 [Amycolatopsis anabasis]|uniref:phospholipase A2 n=1 Tax=Amycolatopsis anabasis TaxID=1840409 RepID=UPI00131B0ADF|nr:phospholipase A2 [Amycolatopsis anabasis]
MATRNGRPLARVAGVCVVALATLMAGVMPASASGGVLDRADYIMNQPYRQFAEIAAGREAPFDWTSDGCSYMPDTGGWKNYFKLVCAQHDFGYRNYGGRGQLKLDPDDDRREWIDDRFREELKRACDSDGAQGELSACQGVADAMYAATRLAGGLFF